MVAMVVLFRRYIKQEDYFKRCSRVYYTIVAGGIQCENCLLVFVVLTYLKSTLMLILQMALKAELRINFHSELIFLAILETQTVLR